MKNELKKMTTEKIKEIFNGMGFKPKYAKHIAEFRGQIMDELENRMGGDFGAWIDARFNEMMSERI